MAVTETQIRELIIRSKAEGVAETTSALNQMSDAQQRLAAASGNVVSITDAMTQRQLSAARGWQGLRKEVDPMYAALLKVEMAQKKADAAVRTGETTREEAAATVSKLADRYIALAQKQIVASEAARTLAAAEAEQVRQAAALEQAQAALAARVNAYSSAVDPSYAAQVKFNAAIMEAEDLYTAGAISIERYRMGVAKAKADLDATAAASRKAAEAEQVRQAQQARQAQASFNQILGVRTDFNAEQRGSDVTAAFAERDRRRAKYVPMEGARQTYRAELSDLRNARDVGDLNEKEYEAAVRNTKAAFVEQIKAAKEAGEAGASGARLARHEWINLGRQVNDVVTMGAMGMPVSQIVTSQAGQIIDVLSNAKGGAKGALKEIGSTIMGVMTPVRVVTGGIAALGIAGAMAWKDWADGQAEVNRSLLGIGRASGATVGQINAIAAASATAGKVSENTARQMASAFAATGSISPDLFSDLIGSAKDFGKIIGEDAVDAAKVLGQAMAEPGKGAERLNATLGAFDAATLKRIQSLEAQNRMTEAQRLMIDGVKSATEGAEKATTGWSKAWERLGVAVSDAWSRLGRGIDSLSGENAPLEDQRNTLKAQIDAQEKTLSQIRGSFIYGFRVPEAEDNLADLKAKLKAVEDQLKLASEKAAELKRNLDSLKYASAISIVLPEIDARRALADRAGLLGALAEDPQLQRSAGVSQEEATRAAERAREAQRSYRAEAERSVDALRLQAEALNARSPAEKAAVAAKQKELELQGSNLSAAEKQLQIDLARSNALREATKQLQDQARERQNAVRDQIGVADAEIAGIGKTAAEAELLRLNYQSYVDLRREAEQNHTAFDQAQFDALRAQNAELVKRNQLLRERKFVEDALFERSQLGRTSEDQRIAASLRSAGLPVDLNSVYAQILRTTDALAEMKDVSSNALSSFIKDMKNGKSVTESFAGALDNLADKAIDKLSDQIVSNLFSPGGQGFNLPNLFGAPQPQVGQPSGGVAGFLGSLFGGGKTAGVGSTMTVSAGIVYVNGAVAGGVLGAAGLGGAANNNAPGLGGIGSDAAASARAAMGSGATATMGAMKGLDGLFASRLQAFIGAAKASGFDISVNSGFRSVERQAQLYAQSNGSGMVAPPGRSYHNYGLAADLQYGPGAREWAHANASKYGLNYPMLNGKPYEPWHIEPAGVRNAGSAAAAAGDTGWRNQMAQFDSSTAGFNKSLNDATSATTQFGSGITDATKTATSALTGTANASQTAGVGVASLGTGAQTAAGATDNFSSGLGGALQQIVGGIGNVLGGIGKGIGTFFGGGTSLFADGGIMTSRGPLPLNFYANGGVAMGAQVAVFGEGRMPEAYVPLPDGRRIPVALSGGERGTADELRAMAAQAQAMEGMMVAANSNARAGSPVEAGPQIHFHNAPPVKESRESTDEQGRKRMDVVFEEQTARALGKTGGPARRALTRPMKYT